MGSNHRWLVGNFSGEEDWILRWLPLDICIFYVHFRWKLYFSNENRKAKKLYLKISTHNGDQHTFMKINICLSISAKRWLVFYTNLWFFRCICFIVILGSSLLSPSEKTCLIEKFPLAIFAEYAWPLEKIWWLWLPPHLLWLLLSLSLMAVCFPLDPRWILPAGTNALFTFLFFNSFLHQNPWSCCFHCLESHCQWCLVSFLLLNNVFTDHPVSGITPSQNVIVFFRVLISSLS